MSEALDHAANRGRAPLAPAERGSHAVHRFRVLEPDSDQTKALKALTRAREDFVTARVALVNQLRIETARDGTQRRAIVALSHDATLDVGRYTAPGWTAELLAGRSRGLQALSAGRAEPEP